MVKYINFVYSCLIIFASSTSLASLLCLRSLGTHEIEVPLEKIVYLVHATDTPPLDGKLKAGVIEIKTGKPILDHFRSTIHLSIGALVREHDMGDWNGMKYVVLVPYRSVEKQIINVSTQDTFVLGDLILPPGSILISRTDDIPSFKSNSEIQLVINTDQNKSLRDLVEEVIQKNNGITIQQLTDSSSLSGPIQVEGQILDELSFLEQYGLIRPDMSRGGENYPISGEIAPLFSTLEMVSTLLLYQSRGLRDDPLGISVGIDIANEILLPKIDFYIDNNNLNQPNLKKMILDLRERIANWQKHNSTTNNQRQLSNDTLFELAHILKILDKSKLDLILDRFNLKSDPLYYELLFHISSLKLFNPSLIEKKYFLNMFKDALLSLPKEDRVRLVKKLIEILSTALNPNSEYLPSILEIMTIDTVFEIISHNHEKPKAINSTEELFNALVPNKVAPSNGDRNGLLGHKIVSLVAGKRPYRNHISEIFSWGEYKRTSFSIEKLKDNYKYGIQQVFMSLNSTDTLPTGNYTIFSFYRDVYMGLHGSINELATKLKLSDNFLIKFSSFSELFQSNLSLVEIIEHYEIEP